MDFPEVLIPLAGICLVFGIPLIAILTHHQRKMAEMIHKRQQETVQNPAMLAEITALRQQVANLQDRVNQIAISADTTVTATPPPTDRLESRLG